MFKLITAIALLFAANIGMAQKSTQVKEAKAVINRFTHQSNLPIKLKQVNDPSGKEWFETKVSNGTLEIKGSSGTALTRGFYTYLKQQHGGIQSWSGNRFSLPLPLANQPLQRVESPYTYHYYFNVVTYGYTMPYWDWNRWEQEIDWMAMHGINMPLALVANEAITARVWKRLGLTDKEISEYFVGPAHLPWMRMGNISGIDGPLPQEWHKDQVELQHKILARMRGLGMNPICPGFAGFVPQSLNRLFPDIKIVKTSWAGAFHNWMLDPEEPLFKQIGKMFIEEWEKEFGKNKFYIVDSFNEMDIPFPPKEDPKRYELLAHYGDLIYQSIKAGNKDAVWVMQGWMFGYQRNIWDKPTLDALLSRVPNDKMILLDLAVDYNKKFWKTDYNWDFYKGYEGKQWVYSVIPNMGGKSALTGILSFYANGHLDALNSPNKGNMVGYGSAPEGIENNEVVYELITDAGWTDKPIDVDQWLKDYTINRYGTFSPSLKAYWDKMRESVYGTFTDHPRYSWQFRPGAVKKGSVEANSSFYESIEAFAAAASTLKGNKLYENDLRTLTAAYVGGKVELLGQNIEKAYSMGDTSEAKSLQVKFLDLLKKMDMVLAGHPNMDLKPWIEFARNHGNTSALADYYEKNARRIVTIWGPPIDDYSARIWSGLIRDYYLPRWKHFFEQQNSGKKFDFARWERSWVEQSKGLSTPDRVDDITSFATNLIKEASTITPIQSKDNASIGSWNPLDVSQGWKTLEWNIPTSMIKQIVGIKIQQNKGEKPLQVAKVSIVLDGKEVVFLEQEKQAYPTCIYNVTVPNDAQGNNSAIVQIKVKSQDPATSTGSVSLLLK